MLAGGYGELMETGTPPSSGSGGGAIEIGASGHVTISASILVGGGTGTNAIGLGRFGGGGGGGGILTDGESVSISGQLGAGGGIGGEAGYASAGGGGGGGQVAIFAGADGLDLTGAMDVSGGVGGPGRGETCRISGCPATAASAVESSSISGARSNWPAPSPMTAGRGAVAGARICPTASPAPTAR